MAEQVLWLILVGLFVALTRDAVLALLRFAAGRSAGAARTVRHALYQQARQLIRRLVEWAFRADDRDGT